MNRAELAEQVERLVDATTLSAVLRALTEVCRGKAEHLRANWQDEATARSWDYAGRVIDRAESRIDL